MVTLDLPIWMIKDVNVYPAPCICQMRRKVGMIFDFEVCRWCETGMGR